jgi:hypothetical protein
MFDAAALPTVRTDLESLTEAVYTLAAVQFVLHEALAPDQAALRVVALRHEVRDALATWTPPRDSYRAQDLASPTTFAAEQPPASGYRVRREIDLDAPDGTTELVDLLAHDGGASLRGGDV